ncbi:ADP-ribosylglycohydrolase family protein [Candidatus Formimonas warabiya]|uniref:ADP-ribosyl-[dinitrogen reductase] hydrolase n=1 Tax=Formimonas warabiya TaxID=1761012 RepID=A0A3G1L0H2_FORW1|nr:ADP-ribosylglycohydrolase family protein [Candidatus Formimonas warabiya]ATW28160.1 hypothetical protein DCMF_28440 [Candidatus Formimonas warabiya]
MEDKIRGGLYGVAVGDALGATVEFLTPREIKEKYGRHSEMIGGGWLSLKPGQFTDDTYMTMAVAEGLLADPDDPVGKIGAGFMSWFRSNPPDVGNTVRTALTCFAETGDWEKAAREARRLLHGRVGSNGCLMRTLPVTFAYLRDPGKMAKMSRKIAAMTHQDPEAEMACAFYNRYAAELVGDQNKEGALRTVLKELEADFKTWGTEELYGRLVRVASLRKQDLRASGYVVDTLIAALKVFLAGDDFENTVVEAVNLGDDTDTVGAVTGGLAGVYYGFGRIPQRWLEPLKYKNRMDYIVEKFLKTS